MMLGDTVVKAGTYSFFVIPSEKEWTAIINTELMFGDFTAMMRRDYLFLFLP